jgi:cation diffusion facilitator family transporter
VPSETRQDPAISARLKTRAAALSLAYNITLTVIKLVAAVLSGSVSLLSEATHSATDIVASGIAFVSVRAAAAPPDDEHPYGHGKIESLAGFGESILLLLIVAYVGFESVQRLIREVPIQNVDFGIWVMAFSVATSFLVSRIVGSIGKRTASLALESNSQHLMMDCVTSAGVLVALYVAKTTGWNKADPAFALVLAAWMAHGAWKLARRAFDQLIDRRLADEELARIIELIDAHPGVMGHHRLRTRRSGDTRYVDFHLVVPTDWSVTTAHDAADLLERRLETEFAPAVVVIHVDPYDVAKDRQKNADK